MSDMPESSPATSSSSSAPSSSPSGPACWGTTLTALGGLALIGTVILRALPWVIDRYNQGDYKPALGACFMVSMLVAPADTLGLVRRFLPKK